MKITCGSLLNSKIEGFIMILYVSMRMRFIEEQDFNPDYAEAIIEDHLLTIPEGCEDGLEYVQQFVNSHGTHHGEIYRCYIPDKYIDDLIEIRENTSSRRFSAAVSNLCVDGQFSETYTGSLVGVKCSYGNQIELEQRLSSMYSKPNSSSVRSDIISVKDVINNIRETECVLYLPQETADFLRKEAGDVFRVFSD